MISCKHSIESAMCTGSFEPIFICDVSFHPTHHDLPIFTYYVSLSHHLNELLAYRLLITLPESVNRRVFIVAVHLSAENMYPEQHVVQHGYGRYCEKSSDACSISRDDHDRLRVDAPYFSLHGAQRTAHSHCDGILYAYIRRTGVLYILSPLKNARETSSDLYRSPYSIMRMRILCT